MSEDVAINVSHVSKNFKLPHESQSSLKGKLINFNKRGYELQHALTDISFQIKKGEFYGIVGRNGGGKSTLLKLISGIYAPNEGSIQINGKLTPFIELGVGFNPELSGRDNVFLNGALLGFNRKEVEGLYDSIVAFAELERFMDQKLKNYSSGMQVRLAFSIAIRAQSDILVLDEVLAVGDAAFQQKCFDYFGDLKSKKKTIVFVTHDMDSVRRFCDKALMLEGGKIKAIGSPQEISDIYLEANINTEPKSKEESGESGKVSAKLLSNKSVSAGDDIEFLVNYVLPENRDHYIGISLQQGGIPFAELNSKNSIDISPTKGKKQMKMTMKTDQLNGGGYDIGVAVFDKATAALISFKTRALSFAVKDKDDTKGGPMRLNASWSEE